MTPSLAIVFLLFAALAVAAVIIRRRAPRRVPRYVPREWTRAWEEEQARRGERELS